MPTIVLLQSSLAAAMCIALCRWLAFYTTHLPLSHPFCWHRTCAVRSMTSSNVYARVILLMETTIASTTQQAIIIMLVQSACAQANMLVSLVPLVLTHSSSYSGGVFMHLAMCYIHWNHQHHQQLSRLQVWCDLCT